MTPAAEHGVLSLNKFASLRDMLSFYRAVCNAADDTAMRTVCTALSPCAPFVSRGFVGERILAHKP